VVAALEDHLKEKGYQQRRLLSGALRRSIARDACDPTDLLIVQAINVCACL
jgi:hypothetical protein